VGWNANVHNLNKHVQYTESVHFSVEAKRTSSFADRKGVGWWVVRMLAEAELKGEGRVQAGAFSIVETRQVRPRKQVDVSPSLLKRDGAMEQDWLAF
jgi:hypothetical protein